MISSKDIKIKIDKVKKSFHVNSPKLSGSELIFLKSIKNDDRKSVQTQLISLRKYIAKIKRHV
jgi:hypothetical protein